MIVSSTINDSKTLTEIALKSKGFWGYTDEQIQNWTAELTVSKQIILEMFVYKFLVDEKTVGFYILNQPKEKCIELEFLFVLPKFIGKGIGKQLLQHSFEKAIEFQVDAMTVLADPNAVPFYSSQGFVIVAKKDSSIAGRFLSVMQKDLSQ